MPSTDFGSNQKSPGGYGGSSGGQSGGSSGGAGAGKASNDQRNYNYSSGKQPNGTTSQGNWNTGGKVVATGNPSNIKPVQTKKPSGIAEAVSGPIRVRKKISVIPQRRRYGALKKLSRWSPDDMDIIERKPIYGAGTPSPERPPYNPGQLPGNNADYDPTTGRYNDYYDGPGSNYSGNQTEYKSAPKAKDQSRVGMSGMF
jgi:hypothetical protein